MAGSVTQNGLANAKVGKSDYERASAGTRGNDEDPPQAATFGHAHLSD
jgi:hypothetical protein